MDYSHLEDRFEKLNHYNSEIDSSAVWNRLEHTIKKDQSDNKILIFWFGFLMFALINAYGIKELNKETKYLSANTLDQNPVNSISTKTNNFTINESNEIIISDEYEVHRNVNQNQKVNQNKSVIQKKEMGHFDSGNFKLATADFIMNFPDGIESKSLIPMIKEEEMNKGQILDEQIGEERLKSIAIKLISKAEVLALNLLEVPDFQGLSIEPTFCDCLNLNLGKNKFQFSIRPYSQYDLSTKQIDNKGNETDFSALRNNSEMNDVAFSYGVEFRAKTRMGLGVFTGVNQSIIRDQFDYSIEKDTTILFKDIIKDISINANQDSVITIGDTIVNARVLETGRIFNQYKSLDIPVGIDFTKQLHNFELGLSASALINLTFKGSGSSYNSENEIESLNGAYKNNIAVRFRFAAPVSYYLTDNMSLGISPSVTYSPKSISSYVYPLGHRVTLFSIRFYADYLF